MRSRASSSATTSRGCAKTSDIDHISSSLQEAGDGALIEAKAKIRQIKDNVDGIISSAGEKRLIATKALHKAGKMLEESLCARLFATLAAAVGGFIFGASWRR